MAAQLADKPSFVIKPAQGSGGKGILVVTGRADGLFVKSSGLVIDEREIQKHTSNILAGLYSLGGRNDSAMVEALIDFDPRLQDYSVEGVPDIRIIVFRGVIGALSSRVSRLYSGYLRWTLCNRRAESLCPVFTGND